MRKITLLALLALVMVGVVGGGSVFAQDEKVVCDSDLILSLYTAEYYLNFSAIRDEMMKGEMAMDMVDLSKIDHGPYQAAFDGMMGMMDSSMAMEGSMISGDTAAAVVKALEMSPDDMMMEMPEGAMALSPLTVEGEPAECAALRTELAHFNAALLYVNEQMMMSGS